MNTPITRAEGASRNSTAPIHRELGSVRWLRDFDAALAQSRATGKPVLILFDEVPGCHTCISFGETVLTHPLIVEAAEDLFVPVAVFNNIEGADRAVLKSFNEPEWNNPVVRIVDAQRTELVPRVDGDYSPRGVVLAMAAALRKTGRAVPGYLSIMAEEFGSHSREKAVYSMHCFWEGEARLGAVPGVLATRTGFQNGREVVEVTYDSARVRRQALDAAAKVIACTREAEGGPVTPSAKDDKYQLRGTPFESLPMTPAQASRMNAASGDPDVAKRVLSPRQAALLDQIQRSPKAGWPITIGREDIASAWREVASVAGAP
ncbi:MAG: thioredoxin family protein [Phycisphaerae bacterium]|nr:thioredoxin family protein [Phycisphaerae bacterium]